MSSIESPRPGVPGRRAWRIAEHAVQAAAVLAAALAFAPPAGAEPWTLERVLDSVRRHDPAVRAEHASGDAGRARAAQAWALLSPHVSASTGFSRGDDPAMLFTQRLWQGRFTAEDFALDALNAPAPRSALQWNLTAEQPLWNGGREWSAPALAAHGNRAAAAMESARVADQLLAAAESHADAVRARGAAEAAELAESAANAMRAAARERLRAGQVAELDTLRALAHAADAHVRVLGARRGLLVALQRLSSLAGAPVSAADLAAPSAVPALPDRPGAGRGELRALREQAAAAAIESRTSAGRLLPSLNSRFAVSQYRPWDESGWRRRWTVGIFAEMPLFDGGQRLAEWREARARSAEAAARANAAERDFATALAAVQADDDVSAERAEAAHAGRVAADEAARLASRRYLAGLLPLTEWLAAESEAATARASENDAVTARIVARYRLLHAEGELR